MVQILPVKQNLGDILGQSIGHGFGAGMQHRAASQYEQQQKQQQQQQEFSVLDAALRQGGTSPQSKLEAILKAPVSNETKKLYSDYIGTQQQTTAKAESEKAKNEAYNARTAAMGAKPQGGLTGQPVPPEVGNKIKEIVQTNPSDTADDLAIKFDEAGVPRGFSNSYIENRRRQDETRAKQNINEKELSRKEQLDFHRESQKYDEDLLDKAKVAKKQIGAVQDIEKALASGKVKPSSMANIFKGLGPIGDKISNALLNENEASILASIPQLLEGWKEVFGVRLSDADLKLLEDKLPSIGRDPESNRAVLKIMKKYGDMTLLRDQIASEIKSKSGGLRPLGYANKIEARFDEMTAPVRVINPNTGRVIEIPAYKVSDAIKSGATLANE